MRELFGMGTPRGLQGAAALVALLLRALQHVQIALTMPLLLFRAPLTRYDSLSINSASRRPRFVFATES